MSRPKILVFAYACEPNRGSEPGVGWLWSQLLAEIADVWIITRENNAPVIEAEIGARDIRTEGLKFVYVDIPKWASVWKKGSRGVRLYYLLWQAAALKKGRKLHRELSFDLVWQLTIFNQWLGSLAGLVGPKFVYGPVQGGIGPPWNLVRELGAMGILRELTRSTARWTFRYINPAARAGWATADLILAENVQNHNWVPRRYRPKAVVFSAAFAHSVQIRRVGRGSDKPRTAIYAGRLLPHKGVGFALKALALLPDWRLLILGAGPDDRRLRRLVRQLRIADRVRFLGWVPQSRLHEVLRDEGDVFVYPSLHDEVPQAVIEAEVLGLPVVCLDWGGPPSLGGRGVKIGTPDETVRELAAAISSSVGAPAGRLPTRNEKRDSLVELLIQHGLIEHGEALEENARGAESP